MSIRPFGFSSGASPAAEPVAALKNTKLAIFGDSITAQCSSLTVGIENYGYICHAMRRSGQRFTFDINHNFGVGGDTSTMALARIASVIASDVGVCVVMVGVNDRGSAAMTADQTMANLLAIRDQLKAAGIVSVFMTPTPRGDSVNISNRLSATNLGHHVNTRRRMLRDMPQTGCYVVDLWPNMANKASLEGDVKLGYTHDGLHPNATGAFNIGKALAETLVTLTPPVSVSILPVTNADIRDATNNVMGGLCANPTVQGVGGSPATDGSGNLADSWFGTNGGGTAGVTRVYSKVTTSTGDWQQVVIGGATATSNSAIDIIRQTSLHSGTVVGGVYEFVGEYEIDAGVANVLSLQAGIQLTDSNGTLTLWDGDRYTNDSKLPAVADTGIFRSPQMTVASGATDLRARLSCYMSTDGTPAATIRVRNLTVRRVS